MRVFLISCVAVVVLAIGAFFSLDTVQKRTGVSYTSEGARINPAWSVRQIFSRAKKAPQTVAMAMPTSEGTENNCDVSSAWEMVLADFRSSPTDEPACEH